MKDYILEDRALIRQYHINVSWSKDDQAYIAEIPELPGCLSDGATEAEARQNILLVAQEWIDTARLLDRPIPKPTHVRIYA